MASASGRIPVWVLSGGGDEGSHSVDKDKQVQKYLKGMKKERSRDERKVLERRSKERKAAEGKPGRKRGEWDEEDAGFERMTSAKDRAGGERGARIERAPGIPTPPPPETAWSEARVLGLQAGTARVLLDGATEDAVLASELSQTQQSSVAVGDRVWVESLEGRSLRVGGVLPRRSVLSRPDPRVPTRQRVLAANLDVAVIVLAARNPRLRRRLIDRFLVAVAFGGARPVICINKCDLIEGPDERREIEEMLSDYAAVPAPSILASVPDGSGIAELRAELAGRCAVFVGPSGVGKSSLLNAIDPEARRETGAVRISDGKGRHTTTGSSLQLLSDGTEIIDTPGIRAFGLWNLERRELRDWFPEFGAASAACRFRDCVHLSEPGCSVRDAVEAGEISRFRFDTYHRILATLD